MHADPHAPETVVPPPRSAVADGTGPTPASASASAGRADATPEALGTIFIGIAGMIGAGKSTLATALGR